MSVPSATAHLDTFGSILRHLRGFLHLRWRAIAGLLGDAFAEWNKDNAPRLGAALAYYAIFSLAPLLVVVISVAGLIFGREAAEGQIFWQIQGLIGREGAAAIQTLLKSARTPSSGILATAVGLLTLVLGASLVVAELKSYLNTVWHVPPRPGQDGVLSGLIAMLRERFLSFALVLGVGFLLLIFLVLNAAIAASGKYFQQWLPTSEAVLQITNFIASFLVTTILFALIYKILPDVEIAWSDVAVGALMTSLLFTLGKLLIGLYLGKSGIGSTYGAAGSLVVLIAWVYYSAQVFFLGAEFTQVYANKYGSRLVARIVENS